MTITETQEGVLKAYVATRTIVRTVAACRMSHGKTKTALKQLEAIGVLQTLPASNRLVPTGVEYRVVPDPEAESKMGYKLVMSAEERAWMLANYNAYRRNRAEAARILGRSRFDVCMMAIKLGIAKL